MIQFDIAGWLSGRETAKAWARRKRHREIESSAIMGDIIVPIV